MLMDALIIPAAFAAMCCLYLIYQRIKRDGRHGLKQQIGVKCAATGMAVLVALIGCLKRGNAADWVLLAGLTACAIADGVLCVRFIPGGALFAAGHILYMVSFCMMRSPQWRCGIVFLCLTGLAAAGLTRFRKQLGGHAVLFFCYAVVLSLMVALASVQTPLIIAGAVLFAVSDGMLACLLAGQKSVALDYISLGLYYLGQFLLGVSICFG